MDLQHAAVTHSVTCPLCHTHHWCLQFGRVQECNLQPTLGYRQPHTPSHSHTTRTTVCCPHSATTVLHVALCCDLVWYGVVWCSVGGVQWRPDDDDADADELHDKHAQAVPLASARQRPENQKAFPVTTSVVSGDLDANPYSLFGKYSCACLTPCMASIVALSLNAPAAPSVRCALRVSSDQTPHELLRIVI